MSLTITIPGAVDVTTGSTAPATLTIGVGVPGAQGPAGPGVPAGGTSGQFLQKTSGADYATDWVTVNPFISSVTSPLSVTSGNLSVNLSAYLTTSAAASTYYPLSGNPSGFLTSSALAGYATQSWVSAGFAPLARAVPSAGTTGQVLTKNSGTDYDASWQTLVPGDRYLTTSTTSLTINNSNKTLTVGTGLSYTTQQDVVIAYDAAHHMHARVTTYNSSTGVMEVDVISHTGTGTYASWTVNVGGTVPLQTVEWGEILGTLGDQTDLSTALNAKLESATAATTYAALAGATFSGEVITPASTTSNAGLTITPGTAPTSPTNGEIWATTNDLQVRLNGVTETIAEQSWVTSQGYLTSSALTPYAPLAGSTFTGKVTTVATATGGAGLNLPHGTAPTSPVNGDVWTTTSGLFMRQNGSTKQYVDLDGTQTINGAKTFSGANQTLGNATSAGTINIGSGATVSGATKAVNIGTAGVSGSTTNIAIGSAVSGATSNITLNGTAITTASTTTAAGLRIPHGTAPTTPTNGDVWSTSAGGLYTRVNGQTRQVMTDMGDLAVYGNWTFFGTLTTIGASANGQTLSLGTGATSSGGLKTVNLGTSGAAGSTTVINVGGTAGTSTTNLQGSTLGVTLAADNNTTGLATTAFVVGQAGSATPLVNGTAAVGTSLRYARADHVHPTDTTRAALNSPAFTGTPSLPTGTTAVTQTAGNNSTAVATTAFVTAAVPAFATDVQARAFTSTTTAINPRQLMWAMLAQDIVYINRQQLSVTNVGTITFTNIGSIGLHTRPGNAGACSSRARILGASNVDQQHNQEVKANPISATNFSLRKIFSGRSRVEIITDTNFTWAWYHGKAEADGVGDLTRRGFGWKMIGGAGSRFLLLQVHNGTTLTSVTSSYAVTANIAFDWDVESDGAGNVTLYVNGTSVATSSAGPTGLVSQTSAIWQEEMQAAAALASPFNDTAHSRGRYIIINP